MKLRNLWRLAGILCLTGAFFLVFFSEVFLHREMEARIVMIYWGSLLCFLGGAVYIAMLDMRFTRLLYKKEERDLFFQTFTNGKVPEKEEDGGTAPEEGNAEGAGD